MAKPMVRGRVKLIDNNERQRRLEYVLHLARHSYVEAGITQPGDTYPDQAHGKPVTVGQVAAWMEFGTHSAQGIEMVPSRSFLRTPVDKGIGVINKERQIQLDRIIQQETSIEDGLKAIGKKVVQLMQNAIVRGIPPRLADSTLRRKRALSQPDTPLIATGFMFDHIDCGVHLDH